MATTPSRPQDAYWTTNYGIGNNRVIRQLSHHRPPPVEALKGFMAKADSMFVEFLIDPDLGLCSIGQT